MDLLVADVLARADHAGPLPKLGGMARPNGVVIVSEHYWAFATSTGELHEGEMPSKHRSAARIPLVRGLMQLVASMAPLVRGRGVARLRERLFLLVAMLAPLCFVLLPSRLELPAGILTTALILVWLFRGRTLRLHGAEHRAIAAAEERSLAATWNGEARPSRFSPRCGTNFAALAIPVTALFDRVAPTTVAPTFMSGLVAVVAIGVTMELWKAVQHPSGLLRGLLLPGLALQRVTTREPELADTRVALRAVASVLSREL
ncbi:MAG TPA: DUF1385 domain-containing protein [Gaiellaceae bacterium]|nr:DUF1385 domain-containing protein [Gaiellaceae bacterium]